MTARLAHAVVVDALVVGVALLSPPTVSRSASGA
jgi:hypothetical protein